MHLSVVVPIFNEEKTLKKNTLNFLTYLKSQSYSSEIILINDGSKDESAKIAKELSTNHKKINFINNQDNRGKGKVVSEGLLAAKGKYRLFIDADAATSIDHIDKIWKPFQEGAQIVIGSRNSRDAKNAQQIKRQILWKRILGIFGNKIIQLLTIKGIYDTQCGFKAFRAETAIKIFPKLQVKRWLFDIELLSIAQKYNYKIKVIPVKWISSDISRVGIKGYFIAFFELLKIKKNLFLKKY